MASNSSSNSGFSSTSVMFGLGAVVSTAERSTFPVLLSSWSNWFANLSKDSTLCCTPSSSVAHILLSSHFKRLSCRFYLPPAGILQPPTTETLFLWCNAVDSVEHQSFLPCLVSVVFSWSCFTLALFPSSKKILHLLFTVFETILVVPTGFT